MTSLPSGLINRYEILKDGASSIYGADAIAGVVNAITRESIDGGTTNFSYRLPQFGEGETYTLDGAWGATGDNWSVSIASSYTKQEAIVAQDLDYAQCPTHPRLKDADGDGNTQNRDPSSGEELCFGMIYGFAISPFGWARYDPSLGPGADASNPNYDSEINGDYGIPYYTRVPETSLDNSGEFYRDTRDSGIAQVQTEANLINISSLGNYDFSISELSATAYYEFYYNRRESLSNGGYRQFFPLVPADNPTNPFGTSGPLGGLGGFTGNPVLPSYNLTDPEAEVSIDRFNLFTGLEGDLTATWTYDVYLGYGYSKGTYSSDQFIQDRVDRALDAETDANGSLVCKDLAKNPDCVAVDLFTEYALLYGRLTDTELNYITARTEGETTYDSLQVAGHVTGELFSLPAGEVSAVVGLEYRAESIDDIPDVHAQNDNVWGSTSAGRTKGTDKVKEIFGELELPILTNVPMAEEISLNISTRWTDYDSYGDDTTYRAALSWQVIPSFRLRATQGTSFRAPDLYEIFLADQKAFADGLLDPCVGYKEQYEPSDIVYMNCAAVVLDGYGEDGYSSIATITGGADNLLAETSDSYTYGFVWQPDELGFSAAVSWYDMEISNTVQSLPAGAILGSCYGSKDFSSPLCSRIGKRGEDGTISFVNASFVNVGMLSTSGYDIDMLYEHSFNSFDLNIDTSISYTDESSAELLGEIVDFEGTFAYPHWRGDMDVGIDYKEWTFNWRIDFIGATAEAPDPDELLITKTDKEFYHTLAARYTQRDWDILATVRNVLDSGPPIVSDGTGSQSARRVFNTLPGAGYSLLGRTFMIQVGYNF